MPSTSLPLEIDIKPRSHPIFGCLLKGVAQENLVPPFGCIVQVTINFLLKIYTFICNQQVTIYFLLPSQPSNQNLAPHMNLSHQQFWHQVYTRLDWCQILLWLLHLTRSQMHYPKMLSPMVMMDHTYILVFFKVLSIKNHSLQSASLSKTSSKLLML